MVNKVILIGNVGNDPDVKYLEGGVAVASLSLATSENYTNKSGEKVVQTEWHNIVAWRKTAEIIEKYVKKGARLYIEGRLRTRSWEDNGVKRYTTEIYVDNFQMLSPRSDASPQPSDTKESKPNTIEAATDDSNDLPF